jgi:tripartite-type tricarboxylate transporter receptor subunit TctC
MPDVPTVAESGIPGFETTFWFGLMAPLNTPDAVVQRLATEMQAVARNPEVIAKLRALGFEAKVDGPQHFGQRIGADFTKWGGLIRQAGISLE